MRTVYVRLTPASRVPHQRMKAKARYAVKGARQRRERLQVLAAKGLIKLVPVRWNRAIDRARSIARGLGVPWTRADDAAFRSIRMKTKRLPG